MSDAIAEELRGEIRSGALPYRAALRQEELAERFAVSRMPVREALRLLERDGLVEIEPNRGAYVVEFGVDEITEVIDLRVLLEVDLLSRAVPRMTAENHGSIECALVSSNALAAGPRWAEGDWSFHERLYAPAGRARQLALVRSLRQVIERYWVLHAQLPAKRERWLDDHARIARACIKGDGERAAKRLRVHLESAGRFLVERLKAWNEAGEAASGDRRIGDAPTRSGRGR